MPFFLEVSTAHLRNNGEMGACEYASFSLLTFRVSILFFPVIFCSFMLQSFHCLTML